MMTPRTQFPFAAALCFLAAFLLLPLPSTQAAPAPALQSFDYQGVRLLPGFWQKQQNAILEYYLAIPTDDFLVGFRKRAGRPAPGKELGGWYSNDVFNSFGQIVSGLSRMYAATGNERAKAKVNEMVVGWAQCIEPDGYFFYSRKTNAPHYEFDKFLGGLLDASIYCKNQKAKDLISPITDWAIKNLDPNPQYPQPRGQANVEGYTLSENLYRAYMLTGKPKYKTFADHWAYWSYWDKFQTDNPRAFAPAPIGDINELYHAYSHVNTLSGLAAGYLATSDTKFLRRAKNAYKYLRREQTYVTGGYGPNERLTSRTALTAAIDKYHHHFETQCGSWAVFKLSKYLQTITGDASYGTWPEQMIYNGIGGSIQMDPKGNVQYFSDYSSRGGTKRNINPWSCCTGTRPQAAADYTDQIFLHDNKGIYVNLYLPAELKSSISGSTISFTMLTDFPESDLVRLKINQAPTENFPIHLRRPVWLAAEPVLRVNGTTTTPVRDERHWITINRNWKPDDVIEIQLPMALKWNPFNDSQDYPGAFTYGPVVLVWQTDKPNPATGRTPQELLKSLRKDGPLLWRSTDDSAARVLPWYKVPAMEKYFMYLDPQAGPYLELSNGWHTNPNHHVAHDAGEKATFRLKGTGVQVHWSTFDDAGILNVSIDGKPQEPIDQYGSVRGKKAVSEFTFSPGEHVLELTATGKKNPASKDTYVNIASIEVTGAEVTK